MFRCWCLWFLFWWSVDDVFVVFCGVCGGGIWWCGFCWCGCVCVWWCWWWCWILGVYLWWLICFCLLVEFCWSLWWCFFWWLVVLYVGCCFVVCGIVCYWFWWLYNLWECFFCCYFFGFCGWCIDFGGFRIIVSVVNVG